MSPGSTNRLPIALSASALLVALFGSTPLGSATGRALGVVPHAKRADYAKRAAFAANAGLLAGHRLSLSPRAGQIPLVNAAGKLPATLGAVGPQGPSGPQGPAGAAGAPGPAGPKGEAGTFDAGKVEIKTFGSVSVPAGSYGGPFVESCDIGQVVLGAGIDSGYRWEVEDFRPMTSRDWRIRVYNPTGSTQDFEPVLYCYG